MPKDHLAGRGVQPKATPEVRSRLLEATRQGVPIDIAATYAGISGETFRRWKMWGREAQDKLEDAGEDANIDDVLNEREQNWLGLWRELQVASAESVTRGVLSVQRGAVGGVVTEETTKKYRDPNTGAVVEEKTVKKSAPDWRAAAWMLERGSAGRQFFGKEAIAVELTGADGGPVQLGSVDATALGQQVLANLAAAREATAAIGAAAATAAVEARDVQDAELVEDDPT